MPISPSSEHPPEPSVLNTTKLVPPLSPQPTSPQVAISDPRALHLSAVNHDLRGGIGGLLLLTELLKADLIDSRGVNGSSVADADSIRAALLDLLGVLDRLVVTERYRLGLVRARPSPVDLSIMAKELTNRFTPLADERGFSLDITGQGTAHTDRMLLSLSAGCLVDNILKHGRPPLARVRLISSPSAGTASGTWSIDVESLGVLPSSVELVLSTPPDPGEMVVNISGGLGLRLVRLSAHNLGATLVRVSTPPLGVTSDSPVAVLHLKLSGKTL